MGRTNARDDRLRAVAKDGHGGASWFETREDALLTMRSNDGIESS